MDSSESSDLKCGNNRGTFVKFFSPMYILLGAVFLTLCCFAHLLYGSCQSSKWHFIIQRYWVEENLPDWMIARKWSFTDDIPVYDKYTGVWITWHKNGKIKFKGSYSNGIAEKTHIGWGDNGVKRHYANFLNGKANGKSMIWHSNGNLWMVANYADGLKIGEYHVFYENGKKRFIENYYKDKRHGKAIHWYKDGKIRSNKIWVKGKIKSISYWLLNGYDVIAKENYEYGSFQERSLFKNGKLIINASDEEIEEE